MSSLPRAGLVRRRALLGAAVSLPVVLPVLLATGCTGGSSPRPSDTPTPDAAPPPPDPFRIEADAAAAAELAYAAACRAVVARRYRLPSDRLATLTAVADRHERYARVLSGEDPVARRPPAAGASSSSASPTPSAPAGSSTPAPTPVPTSEASALADLVARAGRLARDHDVRTRSAETGLRALLWGSLTAAARRDTVLIGRTGPVSAAPSPPTVPAVPEQVTADRAAQRVVAGLHAAVWGYQVALARFDGAAADPVQARLAALRLLRDRVVELLESDDVEVPTPLPDYDPGEPVGSSADAVRLMTRIETRLGPVLGGWVTAAEDQPRAIAVTALGDAAMTAAGLGGRPALWPGWPD